MARLFDGVDDYLRATGITNVSGRYVTLGYWVRIPAGHSNDSFESVASVWSATNGGLGSSFLFAGTEIRGNVLSWMGSAYPTMIAQSAYSTATDYLYLIESDAQAPGDAALFRNGAIIGSRLASESRTTGTTASQLTLAASSDTTPEHFGNIVLGEVFVFTGRFLTSGERADLAAGRNPAAVLDLSANGRYWPLRGTDLTEFYGREALSGVGTTEATHFTVDEPPGAGPAAQYALATAVPSNPSGYDRNTDSVTTEAAILDALATAGDGVWVRSPLNPNATVLEVSLASVLSADGRFMRYEHGKEEDNARQVNQTAQLRSPDGVTLVREWVHTNVAVRPLSAEHDISDLTVSGQHRVRFIDTVV
jgi:hypothetical protein